MSNNYSFSSLTLKMKSSKIRELMKYASMPGVISLAGGSPDPNSFPFEDVKSIINKWDYKKASIAMQYGPTPGYQPLIDILKERMSKKNLNLLNQDLIVTAGGQQGLFLLSKIFIDIDDIVIVEQPSFIGAMASFLSNGANLMGVELENDGVSIKKLEELLINLKKQGKKPKFFYTIPNFQNPAGVTLSIKKRKELYELSIKYDLTIIEDDPYCDLYFSGSPSDYIPIKSFGNDAKILYLGSFSKILCPGFRLGWLFGDNAVIEKAVLSKQSVDACSSIFGQIIAYDYLKEGFIDNYLSKMRVIYKNKRDLMKSKIKEFIPDSVSSTNPEGGFFIYLSLPEGVSAEKVFKITFDSDKVAFITGDPFHIDPVEADKRIRLSFSNSTDEEISKGIEVIGKAVKKVMGL